MNVKRLARLAAQARWQAGQTLVEYMWILVLVSIIAVVLLKAIGSTTNNLLADVNEKMPQ
jgi:competence protein ComGC